jgi:hypothetical protein
MTSIIRRFSIVVLSRTRQSYRDLLFVARIKKMIASSIFVKVVFSTESTSKSWIIANSSTAKTLRVIRLHFIENQCSVFACVESAKQMTYSICENESWLFAKDEFVNITNCRDDWFNLTYRSSLIWLAICQINFLLSEMMSSDEYSIDWAARDRSNDAFDWHINVK